MKSALIALLLFIPPGAIGNSIFTLVKIWIVVLPLFWTWKTNPSA